MAQPLFVHRPQGKGEALLAGAGELEFEQKAEAAGGEPAAHDVPAFAPQARALAALKGEPAQPVATVRIDPGIVEEKIRRAATQKAGQEPLEKIEIGPIAGPGIEREIDGALLLARRVVRAAVQGDRRNPRLVRQDRGRPVALVHVEIEDHDPPHPSLGQERQGGHGQIVEDTEAGAALAEGVVTAPCGIERQAVFEGEPRGREGAAGGGARAVLELAGVRDVLAKSLGSNNALNAVRATAEALQRLRTREEIEAVRKG